MTVLATLIRTEGRVLSVNPSIAGGTFRDQSGGNLTSDHSLYPIGEREPLFPILQFLIHVHAVSPGGCSATYRTIEMSLERLT
ncbi:hypothetical protein AVEN_183196-1, partial [Araneus ventricosus]